MIELEPIGTVSTPYETTSKAPRQGTNVDTRGTIHIEEEFLPGLEGISTGDKLIVIWFADEADRSLLQVDRKGGLGVFKSRSPARPNPICLTTCVVESVAGGELTVSGVDMKDGSPVLDLKPPLH